MAQLYSFHLFAGAGGGILADALLGHWPIGAVEIEPYPRSILLARQRDGLLPPFPVWDDVRTLRADNPDTTEAVEALRAVADRLVVCGGFPCQDISAAGKGAGIDGERSGLWREMARIIREVGPRYVFVENSPMLASRGLGRVLGDLAEMGFDARWGVLGACAAGAPHTRERVWIVANSTRTRIDGGERNHRGQEETWAQLQRQHDGSSRTSPWKEGEGDAVVRGMADDEPDRVDRLRALGNGQVPAVAALAWEMLISGTAAL